MASSSEMNHFPVSGSYKYYLEGCKHFKSHFHEYLYLLSPREGFCLRTTSFFFMTKMKNVVNDTYSITPDLGATTRNFEKIQVNKSKIDSLTQSTKTASSPSFPRQQVILDFNVRSNI